MSKRRKSFERRTNKMSQEKVREILSHVDMSKIDLSSFKLSEKKFNELATLYKNRVILSCVSMIACKSDNDRESVDAAFEIIQKVANNPDVYSYATIYANERKLVDTAIDDITTRRDRNINDVKIKAIEKRMKDAYKQMRKTIEMALENGNSFEYEFDEATVEKCLQIAKDAIESGKQKAVEQSAKKEAQKAIEECEAKIDAIKMVAEAHGAAIAATSPNAQMSDLPEVVQAEIKAQKEKAANAHPKKPFWKRLFGKHEMNEKV
jgi:hypothetical protein